VRFESLLSLLASRSRIAPYSRGVPLGTLALSWAEERLIVLSGCHRHTFSCRATAIYMYPADLRRLARAPGLLHSSPTFQEPSPVNILASYPLLWCLSQNRQPSLNEL